MSNKSIIKSLIKILYYMANIVLYLYLVVNLINGSINLDNASFSLFKCFLIVLVVCGLLFIFAVMKVSSEASRNEEENDLKGGK